MFLFGQVSFRPLYFNFNFNKSPAIHVSLVSSTTPALLSTTKRRDNDIFLLQTFSPIIYHPFRDNLTNTNTCHTHISLTKTISQFNELDVKALGFLQHFILSEDLHEGKRLLVQDVIDRTGMGRKGEPKQQKRRANQIKTTGMAIPP